MSRRPARVVEVRRTDTTVALFWDKQPTSRERHEAQLLHHAPRARIGHHWPGPDDSMAIPAWVAIGAEPPPRRTRVAA